MPLLVLTVCIKDFQTRAQLITSLCFLHSYRAREMGQMGVKPFSLKCLCILLITSITCSYCRLHKKLLPNSNTMFFSSLSFYSKPKLFLPHSAKWFWLFSLMNLKTSGLYCQLCIITKSQRSGAASRLFVPGDFILFDIDIVYTVRIGCT